MKRLNMSPARCARRASFVAATSLALMVPFSAANAGFFDFLFQVLPAPTAAPVYRSAPHFHYHHTQRTVSHHAKFASDRSHPSSMRVVSNIMDDESLKDGDAVMTKDGIRIFTGASSAHHTSDDFVKISETKHLSSRERAALIAIDAKSASAEPTYALLAGRSVSDSGAWACGRRIDYRFPAATRSAMSALSPKASYQVRTSGLCRQAARVFSASPQS